MVFLLPIKSSYHLGWTLEISEAIKHYLCVQNFILKPLVRTVDMNSTKLKVLFPSEVNLVSYSTRNLSQL